MTFTIPFAIILIGAVLWAIGVPYSPVIVLIGIIVLVWYLIVAADRGRAL